MTHSFPTRRSSDLGMGETPVAQAQDRHGKYHVEGVLFTAANKLALATLGKQTFEDRKLRIPADPVIRADLHKLQKTASATGTPRFVADRKSTRLNSSH